MSARSNSKSKLSRRKFLLGSAATVAGAAVTVNSERASAFFNTFGFMKKPAGSGQTSNGYAIGQSLRFTSALTTKLSFTPTVAPTSLQKRTISFWVKKTQVGSASNGQAFMSAWGGLYEESLCMEWTTSNDQICFDNDYYANAARAVTTAFYRDPSAWMHVVVAFDTTQATQSNRAIIYINGAQTTWTGNSYASGNIPFSLNYNFTNLMVNGATTYIGVRYNGTLSPFDGYLAEFHFIDGQALTPSSFGQVDSNSGQWIPKQVAISDYGKNGFYLNFSNSSNLGADTAPISGNHTSANNWTATNFATYDQGLDSPTNNFCTLNPLYKRSVGFSWSFPTLARGNLSTTTAGLVTGTMALPPAQKTYFEVRFDTVSGNSTVGVVATDALWASATTTSAYIWYTAAGTSSIEGGLPGENPNVYQTGLAQIYANDVIGVAVDLVNNQVQFYYNGSAAGPVVSMAAGKTWYPISTPTSSGSSGLTINFGQGGQTGLTYDAASGGRFKFTPPAGFKALCTANLAVPSIKKPSQYFNALLYTGDGIDGRSITGLGFQPDLVWIKSRMNAYDHRVSDSLRGGGKYLASNQTQDEASSQSGVIGSFLADGFTLTKNAGTVAGVNDSNGLNNYVAWCWKAGSAAVSNTQGTITSTVNVNTTTGFSIASWTGTGSSASIGHGLGTAPRLIIAKRRNGAGTENWRVYHEKANASPATGGVYLNLTNAFTSDSTLWNNTAPTSTLFYVGTDVCVNASSGSYIAYLWAEVPGFSTFGSYTGNGNADGPFVYCGFKPRWIMLKRTDSSGNWLLWDTSRGPANVDNAVLYPNLANTEYATGTAWAVDILSNGFKLRSDTGTTDANGSGGTFIFAAFAEAPFKYSTAR